MACPRASTTLERLLKDTVSDNQTTEESDDEPDFRPPDAQTSLASLTDGRDLGEYNTAYPISVWAQICVEWVYLIMALLGSLYFLVSVALAHAFSTPSPIVNFFCGNSDSGNPLFIWAVTAASGVAGGVCSSLKWLYHSVAKQRWHRDRLIWRLVVPILSGTLAVFSGFMIQSGIIPFLRLTFDNLVVGAAFGFFVGLFSDNLMAALQRLAFRIFGTVNRRGDSGPPRDRDLSDIAPTSSGD